MPIKLPRTDRTKSEFRNELICFTDPKLIDIEKTMVNLFMLLRHNGAKARLRVRGTDQAFGIEDLVQLFQGIEKEKGLVIGSEKYDGKPLKWWLRSNLTEMVFRGHPEKEKTSSLKPIHLQSFIIRNAKHTRDYFSSDQVYSMLTVDPKVKEELTNYLNQGWDKVTKKITTNDDIDIDSLGILRLIEGKSRDSADDTTPIFDKIKPLLYKDAKKYCDDVHILLQYSKSIPRHVLIDYLKTITAFHLSLYTIKLIKYLPLMISDGTTEIDTELSLVVDVTDDPNSLVAQISMDDTQTVFDGILDYVKAVFMINTALKFLKLENNLSDNLIHAIKEISNPSDNFMMYCKHALDSIIDLNPDEKNLINDIAAYESDDFRKYIEVVLKARGQFYHKYFVQQLDSQMLKNTENGMLASSRRWKQHRRFVLGTKLLEALIQIAVLKLENNSNYKSEPISIEEFLEWLNKNYGLLINGIDNSRFADSNVNYHLAFKDNLEAFKNKLRQIGFYSVLSDAYIMQKIRPRYTINT